MSKIEEAKDIIIQLDFPKAQHNDRSALCLLALLNLKEGDEWSNSENPLIGITPMMDFAEDNYSVIYKANSRESFRRESIHQFRDAGLILYNPDKPDRPVNSPKTVYQIEENALNLIRSFGKKSWEQNLKKYRKTRPSLAAQYAKKRDQVKIPVVVGSGKIYLSAGDHSQLIKSIIDDFAARFLPKSSLIYVGDTGSKDGHFEKKMLADLGVTVDKHGKMPDVVFYYEAKKWLILVEAVTSHGPVDGKRHAELAELFKDSKVGLVYVTAFPDKPTFAKYLPVISWETEVWVADAPSHLVHFNGVRFLGPY